MNIIKYAFILFIVMISCQNNSNQTHDNSDQSRAQKQKISFQDFQIEVPSNWEYEKDNLSFRSREKDSRNTFVVNYMNLNIDTKAALIEAKKISSGNDFFDNAKYTEIKRSTFKEFSSSEISFSGYKEGELLKGTFMTFKFNNNVILLAYMGKEKYINGDDLASIISSFKQK